MIDIYVISGFLGSGKSHFINQKTQDPMRSIDAVFQFESGRTTLAPRENLFLKSYSKFDLDNHFIRIQEDLGQQIHLLDAKNIWIEWNGMTPLAKLLELLNHEKQGKNLRIRKIIYMAQSERLPLLLRQLPQASLGQLMDADVLLSDSPLDKSLRHGLKGFNPHLSFSTFQEIEDILAKPSASSKQWLGVSALVLALFFIVLRPVLDLLGFPLKAIITAFFGTFLQALPFLTLGVFISSGIHLFISQEWIARQFSGSKWKGYLLSYLAAFALPVCDCTSIPVFKSLLDKGVPFSAALNFMLLSPIVNPVVIGSTWIAFNGNWSFVLGRILMGLVATTIISLLVTPPRQMHFPSAISFCETCSDSKAEISTFKRFFLHGRNEYLRIINFLMVGILFSTIISFVPLEQSFLAPKAHPLWSTLFLMLLAFLLSLCSSSDAMIARTLSTQFPYTALMGFLVWGPMMDIKNIMLLKAHFESKFIFKLVVISFTVTFFVSIILGGIL